MGFKVRDLSDKVALVLKSEFPLMSFNEIKTMRFKEESVERILCQINDKRISYPSALYRYIKANKKLPRAFLSEGTEKSILKAKVFDFLEHFEVLLDDVKKYKSSENTFYILICSELGVKDCLKSRLRIYYHCCTFFNAPEPLDKSALNQKQIKNHPKNSICNVLFHSTPSKGKTPEFNITPPSISPITNNTIDFLHSSPSKQSNECLYFNITPPSLSPITNNTNGILFHSSPPKSNKCLDVNITPPPISPIMNKRIRSTPVSSSESGVKLKNESGKIGDSFILPTPEKINYPRELLYFNNDSIDSKNILPLGAINVPSLDKSEFKNCTYLEGLVYN